MRLNIEFTSNDLSSYIFKGQYYLSKNISELSLVAAEVFILLVIVSG